MNKEKLMELVSEAFDKGAYINIHMVQYEKDCKPWKPVTKSTAAEYAERFKEAIGANEIKNDEDVRPDEDTNSFTIKKGDISVFVSYKNFMEEDVDLTGGVEDVG